MALFKALGGWLKAKDREAAEAIENQNLTEFAKNDLEAMQGELRKVTQNLGSIKGRTKTMEDEIKEKKTEIKDRTAKAEQLIAADKEELAAKQCAIIETMQAEVEALTDALKQQQQLYNTQVTNRDKLRESIQACESELRLMKTQEEVTKSNEALATVNVDGAQSAVSKFQERRKKMQERLNTSQALAEEQQASSNDSLDAETAAALGQSKGSALLEKLKAKKS